MTARVRHDYIHALAARTLRGSPSLGSDGGHRTLLALGYSTGLLYEGYLCLGQSWTERPEADQALASATSRRLHKRSNRRAPGSIGPLAFRGLIEDPMRLFASFFVDPALSWVVCLFDGAELSAKVQRLVHLVWSGGGMNKRLRG